MADKIPFSPSGTTGSKTSTGSKKTTGKVAFTPGKSTPLTSAPKQADDPLGNAWNFGKVVLGALGSGAAFIEGFANQAIKNTSELYTGKTKIKVDPATGLPSFGAQKDPFIAAGENATAFTRGQETLYGSELKKTVGEALGKDWSKQGIVDVPLLGKIDLIGLGIDIAVDPTNLIPGKVFTAPLKAAAVGTKNFVKEAKLAQAGQVSEKVATKARPVAGPAEAPKLLKPGAPVVEQFTKKPLIKPENIRPSGPLAERLAQTTKTITEGPVIAGKQLPSLLYKTQQVPGKVPLSQVIASGIEAGAKAATTVIIGETAQQSLTNLARAEKYIAKNAATASRALINGQFQDLAAFEPHVAPDATYVFDEQGIAHTFANLEEATNWVQVQKDSTAKVKNTVGEKPVMDVGPVKITPEIIAKLPTNSEEAKAAQKSLQTIDKLVKKTQGVNSKNEVQSYKNFTSFIDGLKLGDTVDYAVLEKIIKTLDPENKLINKLEKAAGTKSAYKALKQTLIEEGPQTVADTQKRIELLNSTTLTKATGVGNSDAAATYMQNRLDGTLPPSEVAATQSRDAAQKALAEFGEKTKLNDVLYSINRGFDRILKRAYDIMSSPDAIAEATNQGKLAILLKDSRYAADQKAQLIKEFNQYGEVQTNGALMGIMRKHTSATQLDVTEYIKMSKLMNDALLAGLGVRNVYSKAETIAKGIPHFVYLSMHDFAVVMNDAYPKVLKRALFPDTSEASILKTDALSSASIGEAIRMTLEAAERNVPINPQDLIDALLKRGPGQTAWSDTFKARAPKIAKQVAAAITDKDVRAQFERIHMSRAMAAIEDQITSSETLSEAIFTTLLDGWKANLGLGVDTLAARDQLVRDLFNDFVAVSGIFKQQNGDVAQATFQAAAMMFLNGGKLRDLVNPSQFTDLIPDASDAAGKQAYADMMESIQSFFKQQNSSQYAAAGRETMQFPTISARDTAIKRLQNAKNAYREKVIEGSTLTGKAELTKWRKEFKQFQKDLDDARLLAWKNSIPTHHWMDGQWVPSETYSREAALKQARESGKDLSRSPEGLVDRTGDGIDTVLNFPSHKRMSAEQSAAWLKNWRAENNVRAADAQLGVREEAAKFINENADQYDALGLEPLETAQRMLQDETAQAMENLKITVLSGATEYKPWSLTNLGEKLNATTGRWNLKGLLNKAESNILTNSSEIADYAHALRSTFIKEWRNIVKQQSWRDANIPAGATSKEARDIVLSKQQEVFKKAFGYAIDRAAPAGEPGIVVDLTRHLRSMFDTLFGNPENAAITKNGIDPQMLSAAFAKFGLSDKIGFVSPGTLNPSQLADYLKWLPFGKKPEGMTAIQEAVWAGRAKNFAESGEDPFILVTRLAQAIQFARSEKGIVTDFHTQFGYKAQGLTFNQAVREGWVKIEGKTMAGTNLSDHLPLPKDGGLYPPHIAEQFLSINREWNKLYNSGQMPKVMRTMMEIQGFFKATQTIFTARHHITNAFGDTTTALIGGTRNPVHWAQGLQVALKFVGEDARAQWFTPLAALKAGKTFAQNVPSAGFRGARGMASRELNEGTLANKFVQMFKGNEGYGRVVGLEKGADPLKTAPMITVYKNGKLVNVKLDMDSLAAEFKARGIIVGNIFANDIQGLSDSVLADVGTLGERKTLLKTVGSRLKNTWRAIEKPAGSFASYYGNIPRAAHAMQVMQSRSWSSLEEALNAASQKVSTYHPTIQSLSASERRGPRLAFTYYTWLRVAHNAFIDMAMNHTGAMLVPSKIQYNQAEAAGLEPTSWGDPWSNELKTSSPNYLNYSVYGPTTTGDQGPMLFKRSLLPLDILDTWTFSYDPAYSLDENLFNFQRSGPNSPVKVLTKTLLKSANMPIQAFLEPALGVNPSTGAPTNIKDFPTWWDSQINKIGITSLLKGMGVVPSIKPLTPEEQKLKISNFWTGQKGQQIMTPQNIKNAQTEQRLRQSGSVADVSFSDFLKTYGETK